MSWWLTLVVSRIFRTLCSSQSMKPGYVPSIESPGFKPISLGSCSYPVVCPTFAQSSTAVGQPPPN